MIVFGDIVLHLYYTVFDSEENKIGFAPLKVCTVEATEEFYEKVLKMLIFNIVFGVLSTCFLLVLYRHCIKSARAAEILSDIKYFDELQFVVKSPETQVESEETKAFTQKSA